MMLQQQAMMERDMAIQDEELEQNKNQPTQNQRINAEGGDPKKKKVEEKPREFRTEEEERILKKLTQKKEELQKSIFASQAKHLALDKSINVTAKSTVGKDAHKKYYEETQPIFKEISPLARTLGGNPASSTFLYN